MITLTQALDRADAVLIGAGAGLSSAAGYTYSGSRFHEFFQDFKEIYRFRDMYAGGFYPYETPEEYWAYWSRYVYINRYQNAPRPVYEILYQLVKDQDYFVMTTNVDHNFQKAGFEKQNLFYTQGDYGLFQCSLPCHAKTYDNETAIRRMVLSQGFRIDIQGLICPGSKGLSRHIPKELIPLCPVCGRPMSMNLRTDSTFVEDDGWHRASLNYENFLRLHKNTRILLLELGVGYNTPGIIKYPFWRLAAQNSNALYFSVNNQENRCPPSIADRSVCLMADIETILEQAYKEKYYDKSRATGLSHTLPDAAASSSKIRG